jgi:hypothetical protein
LIASALADHLYRLTAVIDSLLGSIAFSEKQSYIVIKGRVLHYDWPILLTDQSSAVVDSLNKAIHRFVKFFNLEVLNSHILVSLACIIA